MALKAPLLHALCLIIQQTACVHCQQEINRNAWLALNCSLSIPVALFEYRLTQVAIQCSVSRIPFLSRTPEKNMPVTTVQSGTFTLQIT